MKHSFPYYHQADAMDCGPTCLRMIVKYYGKPLPTLRELKGTADIILADRNVLERLLAPLRKIVEYED